MSYAKPFCRSIAQKITSPPSPSPLALLTPLGEHCILLGVNHTLTHDLPFVPNQHDDHLRTGVCLCIVEPCCEVVEGLPPGDVVHQQSTSCPTIVGPSNGPKGLLASLRGEGTPTVACLHSQGRSFKPTDCKGGVKAHGLVDQEGRLAFEGNDPSISSSFRFSGLHPVCMSETPRVHLRSHSLLLPASDLSLYHSFRQISQLIQYW